MSFERLKKYRKFLVILFYFVIAVVGFDAYFNSEQIQPHNFILSFFVAALLTNLCVIDSKIVGKPLPFFSYFFVFILFYIATPICIIRAHGFKKGIKIILFHLVGLFLTAFVVMLVCDFFFYSGQ